MAQNLWTTSKAFLSALLFGAAWSQLLLDGDLLVLLSQCLIDLVINAL